MTKFLSEDSYSLDEKRQHLREFITSLEVVLASPVLAEHYPEAVKNYGECLKVARSLVDTGFSQEDLSSLSRAFEPVLYTHKEWVPPLVQNADGAWRTPEWYDAFEKLHGSAAKRAYQLRVTGELKYST